jgi:thymidylate synthase (FAD)
MGESKGDERDKKLLFYLMRNHHTSPFEMVEFKFRVNSPLIVWWQWVRHRTFAYQSVNSQSGRYTEFAENDFYVPSVWRKQSASNKQASAGEIDAAQNALLLDKLTRHYEHSYALYEEALAAGVAKEMARLFLPGFSIYYTWVVKVDALNLLNWLRLRMASDAQYEIRVYAEAIYHEFLKPALPWTAEAFEQYVLKGGDSIDSPPQT